jgi:hypothetical protein
MKTRFLILILLLFAGTSIAQQYTTSSVTSGSGQSCFGVQFINVNTGFAIVQQSGTAKLAKTTNKGLNWQYSSLLNSQYPEEASMQIIDENTFFIVHGNYIDKTTNGGANWFQNNFDFNPGNSFKSPIKFFDANTGYWVVRRNNETYDLLIYKTSDGGSNWSHVFTYSSAAYTYYIKDIAFDPVDPNIVAFAGWAFNRTPGSSSYANYAMFITYDGMATGISNPSSVTKIEDGHSSNSLSAFSSAQVVKNASNQREFRMILNRVVTSGSSTVSTLNYAVLNSSLTEYKVADHGSITNVYTGNGLKFTDVNSGYLLAQGKIYKTTNSGVNWSMDYSISNSDNSFYQRLNVIGNVVYAANLSGVLAIKKLNSTLTTLLDNTSVNYLLQIQDVPGASGYNTYYTPISEYLLGGDVSINTDYNINNSNDAIFYKWSTGQATTTAFSHLTSDGVFSANYKTKNLSTDNTAISRSASVKTLKEAHGNIDRIQTSIGGVFFSRSTNNGTSFGNEEVVDRIDGTAPSINPYLAEVKTILSGGVDAGKNSSVVWEQRNGNNINIMYSQRETVGGAGSWAVDDISYAQSKSFSVDATGLSTFQCLPKLSTIKSSSGSDSYFTVITYLKLDGGSFKLMASVHVPGNNSVERVISAGNISDFAIISKPRTSGTGHDIYYAFLRDNHVFYKNVNFYISGNTFITDSTAQTRISGGDGNITLRYSPDISLRNGKPVIAYQGKYTKYIIPIFNDSQEEEEEEASLPGLPPGVNQTYYPIAVRYMESNNTWGKFYFYESDGVSSQQFPDIEGCTSDNAYLLSFTKSTTQFKHFVKGDNLGEYYCSPSTFSGTDAKLVSGSYITPTGDAIRTTLSTPSSDLYTLGESTIDITNGNIQDPDNAYSNIKGIINFNYTNYVFNLGPIIIQAGEESLFNTIEAAPVPTTAVEFNEYMKSDNFTLREGDTLIIGTDGFYKNYDGISYEAIKYTVNLVSALDDQVEMELLCDTISLGDSTAVEYYRGYIIGRIDDSEQYYVQLVTQGLNPFVDATFTVGGSYDGDDPVEDRGGNQGKTKGIYVDFGHRGGGLTSISLKPTSYSLAQNFPNPFNPSTTIKYSVPNDGLVQIKIYDISGKEVMNLVNENKVAGNYEVKFNGANLSSGIYFYRINAGEFVQTKRMVLVK